MQLSLIQILVYMDFIQMLPTVPQMSFTQGMEGSVEKLMLSEQIRIATGFCKLS